MTLLRESWLWFASAHDRAIQRMDHSIRGANLLMKGYEFERDAGSLS